MTTVQEPVRPDHADLMVMAYGYVHAWLADDPWTSARILLELEDSGASMVQVMETFSLAAAALLTDACGDKYKAMAVAASRYSTSAGRRAAAGTA